MAKRFNSGSENAGSELERLRARDAGPGAISADHILDAAAAVLLDSGLERMTMAEIATRAGVARATLYRRWENVRSVVAALLTREWAAVTVASAATAGPTGRARIVTAAVLTIATIRAHPIHRAIVESDPEFLVPYVFQRMGRSSTHMLQVLENGLREGHEDGSVRPLEVGLQARTVLLLAWSFVVTAPAITGSATGAGPELDALDAQLAEALDRYLAPPTPEA
jgi:AcrR family transcriptional regulator